MFRLARIAALAAVGVFVVQSHLQAADQMVAARSGDPSQVRLISANEELTAPDDAPASNTATYPPKKTTRVAKNATPKLADGDANADPTLSAKPAPKANSSVRRTTANQPTSGQASAARAPAAQPNAADSHWTGRGHVTQASARLVDEAPAPPSVRQGAAPQEPSPYTGEIHENIDGDACCPECANCLSCVHWCAGVDYLLLKPRLSNDTALSIATATGAGTATATTATNNVDYSYDYNSDYHLFVGVTTSAGALRFGYWRLQDSANESATSTGNFAGQAGTAIQGIATTQLVSAGQTLTETSHLHVDLYDIDRLQRLELAGLSDCGAWEVNWLYGVRIGNFHRSIDEFDPIETVNIGSTFTGAGPRIGLEGRRNIWGSRFSSFFSADAALLVGTFRGTFQRNTPPSAPGLQTTVETTDTDQDRVVPNFGLSIGLSWNPTCNTAITAGYMVEAFDDAIGNNGALGCTNCGNTGTTPGTGNILSFDGIFIRMQHCF